MNSNDIVYSRGEYLWNKIFVVALIRVESVHWSPAEDRQLIQKLQRDDGEHVRHHEFPKLRARQWVLQNWKAHDRDNDEQTDEVGIHDVVEHYGYVDNLVASRGETSFQ